MSKNSSQYNKMYYLKNRDKIIKMVYDNAHQEIVCAVCGARVLKCSMKNHKKTRLHQYILNHPSAAEK